MPWWWPFGKGERSKEVIEEAKLIEDVKNRIEMSRIYIRKRNWDGRKKALEEAEATSKLIASKNTPNNIPNSHFRQQNDNLQLQITGLITHIQSKIKMDYADTKHYELAEHLAKRIIDSTSDFLREL